MPRFIADIKNKKIKALFLIDEDAKNVEMRVKGRPDVILSGRIDEIFPAGQKVLPSQALGYAVGGSMSTDVNDPRGITASENFFEVRVQPVDETVRLFSGQRVIVRVGLSPKPLMVQWWRSLRQLFQRRFNI